MKIEIVEFYPIKKTGKNFTGTLHVYIIDTDQDIRGIYVSKDKKNWWFRIPSRTHYDEELKKELSYPIFSFTNVDKNKELLSLIISEGKKYIIENFIKSSDVAK